MFQILKDRTSYNQGRLVSNIAIPDSFIIVRFPIGTRLMDAAMQLASYVVMDIDTKITYYYYSPEVCKNDDIFQLILGGN